MQRRVRDFVVLFHVGFGLGWVVGDAVWQELPVYLLELSGSTLDLGLYLSSASFAGSFFNLLLISFLNTYFPQWKRKTRVESRIIPFVLGAGILIVLAVMAFWDRLIHSRPIPLIILGCLANFCGSFTYLAILPHVTAYYHPQAAAALLTGANVGALFCALLGLLQMPIGLKPLFSVDVYFAIILIALLVAPIAYMYMVRDGSVYKRVDDASTSSQVPHVTAPPPSTALTTTAAAAGQAPALAQPLTVRSPLCANPPSSSSTLLAARSRTHTPTFPGPAPLSHAPSSSKGAPRTQHTTPSRAVAPVHPLLGGPRSTAPLGSSSPTTTRATPSPSPAPSAPSAPAHRHHLPPPQPSHPAPPPPPSPSPTLLRTLPSTPTVFASPPLPAPPLEEPTHTAPPPPSSSGSGEPPPPIGNESGEAHTLPAEGDHHASAFCEPRPSDAPNLRPRSGSCIPLCTTCETLVSLWPSSFGLRSFFDCLARRFGIVYSPRAIGFAAILGIMSSITWAYPPAWVSVAAANTSARCKVADVSLVVRYALSLSMAFIPAGSVAAVVAPCPLKALPLAFAVQLFAFALEVAAVFGVQRAFWMRTEGMATLVVAHAVIRFVETYQQASVFSHLSAGAVLRDAEVRGGGCDVACGGGETVVVADARSGCAGGGAGTELDGEGGHLLTFPLYADPSTTAVRCAAAVHECESESEVDEGAVAPTTPLPMRLCNGPAARARSTWHIEALVMLTVTANAIAVVVLRHPFGIPQCYAVDE